MGDRAGNARPRTSYLVARLDRLIRSKLSDALKPFGLSVPQYTLMSILEHRPGLSNAQLARRSYITAQAMHRAAHALRTAEHDGAHEIGQGDARDRLERALVLAFRKDDPAVARLRPRGQ